MDVRSGAPGRLHAVAAPAVLALTTALVLLSALWKSACLDARENYRLTCYSDVLELWTSRRLADGVFPYVDGRLVDGAPVDTFEYPVLTGVFVWASSLLADGRSLAQHMDRLRALHEQDRGERRRVRRTRLRVLRPSATAVAPHGAFEGPDADFGFDVSEARHPLRPWRIGSTARVPASTQCTD